MLLFFLLQERERNKLNNYYNLERKTGHISLTQAIIEAKSLILSVYETRISYARNLYRDFVDYISSAEYFTASLLKKTFFF